jgi:mRNA interferase RelE/StbE
MAKLDLKTRAMKFIQRLPKKHQRQIKDYILAMQKNPRPHDAAPLVGYAPYMRTDVGEYRIIFRYEEVEDLVVIVLVGKRNDDEVYRVAKRLLG